MVWVGVTGSLSVGGEMLWSWREVKGLEEVHHLAGGVKVIREE